MNAQHILASTSRFYPWTVLPRWIVPHVLKMPTPQLSDPIVLFVLVKTSDWTIFGHLTLTSLEKFKYAHFHDLCFDLFMIEQYSPIINDRPKVNPLLKRQGI